jgi:hypothetical protein
VLAAQPSDRGAGLLLLGGQALEHHGGSVALVAGPHERERGALMELLEHDVHGYRRASYRDAGATRVAAVTSIGAETAVWWRP